MSDRADLAQAVEVAERSWIVQNRLPGSVTEGMRDTSRTGLTRIETCVVCDGPIESARLKILIGTDVCSQCARDAAELTQKLRKTRR